jgi:hypothetical protein
MGCHFSICEDPTSPVEDTARVGKGKLGDLVVEVGSFFQQSRFNFFLSLKHR